MPSRCDINPPSVINDDTLFSSCEINSISCFSSSTSDPHHSHDSYVKACHLRKKKKKNPGPVFLADVGLSNVQKNIWQQENGLWSDRGSWSIPLCLQQCKSIFSTMMNDVPFFIHLSCTYFFLVCVCFFFSSVKGQRTGRSRYSCGTKSPAVDWETTSISTCTSAPRRVATGD